jgi:hypothetical protein
MVSAHKHTQKNTIIYNFCSCSVFLGLVVTSTTASTSTPAAVPINDYVNSQTTSQTPDKPLSEIPISQPTDGMSTAIPTPDPYFTHFDPRIEHQSYKVGLEVKLIYSYTIYSAIS